MGEINTVLWSKKVQKQIDAVPEAIAKKFFAWVAAIRIVGVRSVRSRPGFYDEPLQGDRKGQRSVRLNRAWRAIYIEQNDGTLEFIEVTEVTHHEY